MSECRNGHPRTEENTYIFPSGRITCKVCRRLANQRYQSSTKGQDAHRRAYRKYDSSVRGYWLERSRALALQRTLILKELDRLAAEEAACRAKWESLTRTK